MKLRFSRSADYGLRAVLEVARAEDGALVTRNELAGSTLAPSSVLAQALASLVHAGLLQAQAGPRGGYRLARPPADVSIHDVVTAIDAQEGEQRCVLRENACADRLPCPFHAFLSDAQERFLDALRTTSLADVIASGTNAAGGAR